MTEAILLRLAIILAVLLFLAGCCCLDRSMYHAATARARSLGIDGWSAVPATVPASGTPVMGDGRS